MSQRYSTAGMHLYYAVEATAGTRPTSGLVKIPEIKSIPSFNPSPETIDSTTLEETEFRTYVAGLKDLGGALEFGANLTADLITAWQECNTAHDGLATGKAMWFYIVHDQLDNAVAFQGDPSPLGLNESNVGSMLETTLYITPNSAPTWVPKPTISDGTNVNLGSLLVGTNVLTPFFVPNTLDYTVATANATDLIVATPEDNAATVEIASTDATISSGTATWAAGENTVTITVTNGGFSRVYTVVVTKT